MWGQLASALLWFRWTPPHLSVIQDLRTPPHLSVIQDLRKSAHPWDIARRPFVCSVQGESCYQLWLVILLEGIYQLLAITIAREIFEISGTEGTSGDITISESLQNNPQVKKVIMNKSAVSHIGWSRTMTSSTIWRVIGGASLPPKADYQAEHQRACHMRLQSKYSLVEPHFRQEEGPSWCRILLVRNQVYRLPSYCVSACLN